MTSDKEIISRYEFLFLLAISKPIITLAAPRNDYIRCTFDSR